MRAAMQDRYKLRRYRQMLIIGGDCERGRWGECDGRRHRTRLGDVGRRRWGERKIYEMGERRLGGADAVATMKVGTEETSETRYCERDENEDGRGKCDRER